MGQIQLIRRQTVLRWKTQVVLLLRSPKYQIQCSQRISNRDNTDFSKLFLTVVLQACNCFIEWLPNFTTHFQKYLGMWLGDNYRDYFYIFCVLTWNWECKWKSVCVRARVRESVCARAREKEREREWEKVWVMEREREKALSRTYWSDNCSSRYNSKLFISQRKFSD